MGAEVVVVVVRLEGVLHEPDQAARARAPGAPAAPGAGALFHIAGHGPVERWGSSRVRPLRSAASEVKEGPHPATAAAAAAAGCRGGGRGGRQEGSGRCRERGSARARPFREQEPDDRRSAPTLGKRAAWSLPGSDPS